jgi:N-glycosylase/DNA lyase
MGLGWGEAVPVDTHVWQIAQRDYKFGTKTKTKTFTKAMYDAVGDHFRGIWGPQAGWAQSVLFTANLREFAGQAAGAAVVKEEGEGGGVVVKVEEAVEVDRQADSRRDGTAGKVVVKVEEEKLELVAGRTTRKRKTPTSMHASVVSRTTKQVVVKTEEKQESVAGRTTRKRKISAIVQASAADGESVEAGQVEVQARRASKRLKVTRG